MAIVHAAGDGPKKMTFTWREIDLFMPQALLLNESEA